MKILLLLLILFAFFQSAVSTLNFVLIILIARSLVLESKENLVLAFFGGFMLSFLTQTNLGYWPLLLILVTRLGHLLRKLPVSFNPVMVFIAGSIQVLLVLMAGKFFIGSGFEVYPHLYETLLVVPSYYLIRMWEERFVPKSELRLKLKK